MTGQRRINDIIIERLGKEESMKKRNLIHVPRLIFFVGLVFHKQVEPTHEMPLLESVLKQKSTNVSVILYAFYPREIQDDFCQITLICTANLNFESLAVSLTFSSSNFVNLKIAWRPFLKF